MKFRPSHPERRRTPFDRHLGGTLHRAPSQSSARPAAAHDRADPTPRRRVSLVVLSLLAFIASSCSGTDETSLPISSEETTATSAVTTSLPSGIDEAEVARLWRQLLTVFEASAEARDQVASDLPDQLPVDEALRLSAKYFVTGEPLDLTSNAVHSPKAGGSIEIADCTDSSGPSVLGPTTAGFIATANLTPAGEVEITELDAVVACVQRGPAQAALDSYSLYLQAGEELWSDPRVDHPALGQYRTERAAEAYRGLHRRA